LAAATGKKHELEVAARHGDPLLTTFRDFDRADEVVHARTGSPPPCARARRRASGATRAASPAPDVRQSSRRLPEALELPVAGVGSPADRLRLAVLHRTG
jgi:hypothetical protein